MGLHKNIETPEIMWEHFTAYRKEVTEDPIMKHVFVGKDGDSKHEEIEKPLTYEGFCNYLEDKGVITRPDHYFMNYEDRYADFIGVCSRIKRVIRQFQIERGLAGVYNASITQRLNGLAEKTQAEVDMTVKELTIKVIDGDAPPLAESEQEIKS